MEWIRFYILKLDRIYRIIRIVFSLSTFQKKVLKFNPPAAEDKNGNNVFIIRYCL